mgnify:CR=1 FL=1|tara:strand:+ start:638 stop:964 length:327 start_codon:yes stop_codon:yes gene_type:complete
MNNAAQTQTTEIMRLTAHEINENEDFVYMENDNGEGYTITFEAIDMDDIINETNADDDECTRLHQDNPSYELPTWDTLSESQRLDEVNASLNCQSFYVAILPHIQKLG